MNCSYYSVSSASQILSKYGNINLGWLDSLMAFIQIPESETITWALSYGFISLIVGVVLLISTIILVLVQCVGKKFSTPKERYWIWSIRATRVFLVAAAYIIALLAATGIYYVYT